MNNLVMIVFLILFSPRLCISNSTFYTSVPIGNSIEIPGQDEETINQDPSFPSLIAIHCKKKHGAQAVIKFAKHACKKLKKRNFWVVGPIAWFRTFPVVYHLRSSEDGFEILGDPYYIYPMFKPLFAVPGNSYCINLICPHNLIRALVTNYSLKN